MSYTLNLPLKTDKKMEPIQWGDHCIDLVRSLAELYKNTEFIDCELDTEGGLLTGHRAILAACSPYLKKLLLEHEGRRTVSLKQVKYKDMKYILDFIYYGEVGVPVAGMPSLMETANFLKISSLRSCLSPNAFRKILNKVPVGQCVRGSGSKSNADLSKNCELSSPIRGNRKICLRNFQSEKEDKNDLQTVSTTEKKINNDLEQLSCGVNDAEMQDNIPKIRVIDKELMVKSDNNLQDISSSTSCSPLSPVSMKVEEEHDQNDLSDSDDLNLNVEEYPFGSDDATEKTIEGEERDFEPESRIKIKNGKEIGVRVRSNQDTENMSKTKGLEIESSSGQVPLGENVELANVNIKEKIDSKRSGNAARGMNVTKYVVSLGQLSLLGINPSHQLKIVNGLDFNKMNGLLYNSTSPSEKVLIVKRSSKEEMEPLCVPQDASNSRSQPSSHSEKDVSCPSTSKSKPERENISTLAAEKRYLCNICESSFKSKTALDRHVGGTHTGEKSFVCDVCGKTFKQRSYLVYHMRTHTGEKPYVCYICQAAYRNKSKLNVHMRTHTGERPYSCSVCGKAYFLKHHLARHIRGHTGEKPYQCRFCDKTFHDDGALSAHKRMHTGEKRRVCRRQKTSRNAHVLVVRPEDKQYSCGVCHKSFARKVYLQSHMVTHNGKKSFLCSTCGKAFTQKSTLNMHMLIHTGVKSYLCSVCGKSFLIQHQLKRHMLSHTGEKPHRCSVCEKFFSDKGNLKAHMAIHTGDKHYRCCICRESFNRRSQLKKHLVIHKQGKTSQ